MANINVKIGKRIRQLRKAKGITQEDLAHFSKVDYSYLNEIENGKRNPSTAILSKISKALRVSLEDIFK